MLHFIRSIDANILTALCTFAVLFSVVIYGYLSMISQRPASTANEAEISQELPQISWYDLPTEIQVPPFAPTYHNHLSVGNVYTSIGANCGLRVKALKIAC